MCQSIFISKWQNSFRGLLTGLPHNLQQILDEVLSECQNLIGPMLANTDAVFDKLQRALHQSLNEDSIMTLASDNIYPFYPGCKIKSSNIVFVYES